MAYTTINKSSEHFNTKLWTGTGNAQTISGVGFQPDLSWSKGRNYEYAHQWIDSVRGITKQLNSNDNQPEGTNANGITAFNSDGFVIGTQPEMSSNGKTFASWNWKANGAGSANTDGSINSTVSVNTTAGFSIVSWTPTTTSSPQTIGHGLGVAPKMMIVRNRDAAGAWRVYHSAMGATKALNLNNTDAQINDNGFWNDVEPTSSVFTTGNGYAYTTGGSTDDYIAYCFAEKQGYSKFGSYIGNGNADGTFVYTGFKPAFVMFKKTSGSADNWQLWDNKRDTFNPVEKAIHPDIANTASTDQDIDFLSNGFKIRSSVAHLNQSGVKSIYMAFAEAPLVGTNNVPCTAR